ncbi:MAG TPA: hypothetical protein VEU52_10955 [Candidatus Limnocylindrales bacterium]|nr:hypothetical protein [Candidatus Limnocylindrales bacterium]
MATERDPHAAPSPGYERSDASPKSLLKFGIGLFLILVACILGMRWMFFYFAKVQQLGPPASPFENARVLPPQPRLQVHPRLDLEKYLDAENRTLTTYGWVDKQNGVVRIPVDRAMELLLERGLPARSAAEEAAASRPTESATHTEGGQKP